MRTFVIGDIHAQQEKLETVLMLSQFNFGEDHLIVLGDVVDRGNEPFECIRTLCEIQHLTPILGNHDLAFVQRIFKGKNTFDGKYGSDITIEAWNVMSKKKQDYLNTNYLLKMKAFYKNNDNIFVHGGFNNEKPLAQQDMQDLCTDRNLWEVAMVTPGANKLPTKDFYSHIYIGHTPTTFYNFTDPMYRHGIWNLNTGCGRGGKLTIMDIASKEYWQA